MNDKVLIFPWLEFLNVPGRSDFHQAATGTSDFQDRIPVYFDRQFSFAALIERDWNLILKNLVVDSQVAVCQVAWQLGNGSFDNAVFDKNSQLLRPTGARIDSGSSVRHMNKRWVEMQNHGAGFVLHRAQP